MRSPDQDPTRGYSRQPWEKSHLLHTDWNDLPPPRDPVRVARAEGRVHVNQATGAHLFSQSVMPVGEHLGKIMERVPLSDLRRYYHHRHQFQAWPEWRPVLDYLARHPHLVSPP